MPTTRPNLLIFMTDQQQAATVLPEHPAHMPRVAQLAEQGVTFASTFCPAPHCCPARASFFSGLYPSRHGIYNNVATDTSINNNLKDGVVLFSEELRAAGYRLAISGKWHVSRDIMPEDRGWENYGTGPQRGQGGTSRNPGTWLGAAADLDAARPRRQGELIRPGWGNRLVYGSVPNQGPNGYEGTGDHRTVLRGLEALGELAAGDEPWCLYVGVGGPHDAFVIPEHYANLHDPADVPLPPNFHDDLRDKPRIYQRMRHQYWGQLTEQEVRESIAHYWGYCAMEDDLFGLVVDALDATGQADDTVLLYMSDHGEYCGAHGLYCKGIPAFREAYQVPCVARWPKGIVEPGRRVDAMVSLTDFAPTFLELGGAEPRTERDGQSLVPFLKHDPPAEWRDELHTQCNGVELYYTQRSVMTDKWKYVYNGFDFDELYDLEHDPHELENLAFPNLDEMPPPHVTVDRDGPWPPLTESLEAVRRDLLARMWRFAKAHDDHLFNPYFTVALAPYGPGLVCDRE